MTFSLIPSYGFGANVEPLGREKKKKRSSVLMFNKRLYIRSNTLVSICQPSRQLSILFFWESVQGQWHSDGLPCQARARARHLPEKDMRRNCVCVLVCMYVYLCMCLCVIYIHFEIIKKKSRKRNMKNDLFVNCLYFFNITGQLQPGHSPNSYTQNFTKRPFTDFV